MRKRERARAARAMVTAMRGAGGKEGKGNTAIAMGARMAGEWPATATKWAIATGTRVACKQQ